MSRHSQNLRMWDDLRAPASGVDPVGPGSPPGYDTTNGGLLFDSGLTEIVAVQFQMPHAWAEGTYIVPHVHWQKTTSASGNVYWELKYKWAPLNQVMDTNFTTLVATTTVDATPDTNTANKHMISSFGAVDCTGKKISDMLLCVLSRVGGNGADTYGADARLLEIDIHYQIDSLGSEQQFRKQNG